MDSDEVFRLHREGWLVRRIAKRVGWSRMRVHRLLTRENPPDPPIELGGDDYEPIPPFVFVAMEADEPGQRQYERFLDGNLVSCNVLDIYRRCARQGPERGDYEAGKRVWADVDARSPRPGGSRPTTRPGPAIGTGSGPSRRPWWTSAKGGRGHRVAGRMSLWQFSGTQRLPLTAAQLWARSPAWTASQSRARSRLQAVSR